MKKIFVSAISLLIVLLMVAPMMLSVVSFAADNKEEDIWENLQPAYMKASFNDISERISGNDVIAQMECRAVVNGYALYVDPLTAEVVCLKLKAPDAQGNYSKTNGVYDFDGYYSTNPYATGKSVSSTNNQTTNSIKQQLYSQLLLQYTDNGKEVVLNSFKDAAINNQITVKNIRNGIRVEYTLGREEATYLVPRRIRYDKFVDLLVQVSQNATERKDKRTFASFYTLYAIDPSQLDYANTVDQSNLTEETKDFLFTTREQGKILHPGKDAEFGAQWGILPSHRESVETQSNKTVNEYKETYKFIESFAFVACNSTIQSSDLKRLEQIIKLNTDYSKEQLTADHAETEYVANDKIPALFKMAIEYTINQYGLQIRLNAGNIRFDSSNYKISDISFLPYAGAVDTNNEGFIFSPDGAGSIIRTEDIYGQQFTTTRPMYGQDYAYHTVSGSNKEVMRFPGFGVVETLTKKEEYTETEIYIDENGEEQTEEVIKTRDIKTSHGYFGVLTEGATLSKLTVVNGGPLHMFASVYTSFNPRPKDSYVLDGGISAGNTDAMWTVESKRKYTGDYKLQIFILDNDHSNYVGMATVYRDYLEKEGIIARLEETENKDIPLYIQTLGAIETTDTFLGVPYDTTVALTSFVRVKEILENFKNNNITNVKVVLQGISKGGMLGVVPTELNFEKALEEGHGDVEGITFDELVDYAKANGIQLFPDFNFSVALRDDMFDGFDSDDLSKTIDGQSAIKREYDPVWQAFMPTGEGIISPNSMNKFYDSVYSEYKDYNVGGISVQSLGDMLSSDFNDDNPLNREDSRKLVVKLLKKIKEQNGNVLVSGGNAYAVPYVTDIVDMPLDDSRYKYSKASIPFLGIVYHGYKEYAGTPLNLAGNETYSLLKTIESGASPYYTVAYDNTSELKDYASYSSLSQYYSIKYSILYATIVQNYRVINNALSSVKYSTVVDHEFLDDDYKIVKVTYDNGDVFYLNYYREDYTLNVDGKKITIPAQYFLKNPA